MAFKDQEWLGSYFRLEQIEETWQLNALHDPGLNPFALTKNDIGKISESGMGYDNEMLLPDFNTYIIIKRK